MSNEINNLPHVLSADRRGSPSIALSPAECLAKRNDLLAAARDAEAAGNMAVATRSRTLASNLELMASEDPATRDRGKLWFDKNRADLDAYLNKTGPYAGGENSPLHGK